MARPLAIQTPEEFEERAEAYFAACEADDKRPTINGLVLALGLTSRQSLHNYEARPEFMDSVKRARTIIEAAWEECLAGPNVAGTIFWLKNQGWTDKVETELTGKGGGPVESVTRIERVIVSPSHSDG